MPDDAEKRAQVQDLEPQLRRLLGPATGAAPAVEEGKELAQAPAAAAAAAAAPSSPAPVVSVEQVVVAAPAAATIPVTAQVGTAPKAGSAHG